MRDSSAADVVVDPGTVRGLIFVSGRNCAAYVQACLRSLSRQTHRNFDVLFVDDASTDDTVAVAEKALAEWMPGRHELVRNQERFGKARNAYEFLSTRKPADFVAVLDADDQIVDDRILEDMATAYAQGYDVVWSNFRTDRGRLGNNGPVDPFLSPRGQGWRTSHFFSFRHSLFQKVPVSYFQDEGGQWLMAACDFAIAYPMLDQTRRYLFIPRVAYQYTETNANSHHNLDPQSVGFNSRIQSQNARVVLNKAPMPCVRFPAEVPGILHAALGLKFSQLNDKLDRVALMLNRVDHTVTQVPFTQRAVFDLADKENIPIDWLHDTGGAALDPGLLHHIARTMARYPNPRVLEFGSGRGTKSLARLCANRGGKLISVEHNPIWHDRTHAEIDKHGLADTARIVQCPLAAMEFYEIPGKFYNMGWLSADDVFDIVVVDGPPAATCALARLPALPAIAQHLSTNGFHVYLTDFERDDEQRIVEIWRQVAPDMKYETLSFAKKVCEITADNLGA